jgi:hypothetical protein
MFRDVLASELLTSGVKIAIRKGQTAEATNALHQEDQSENELIAAAGFEAGRSDLRGWHQILLIKRLRAVPVHIYTRIVSLSIPETPRSESWWKGTTNGAEEQQIK